MHESIAVELLGEIEAKAAARNGEVAGRILDLCGTPEYAEAEDWPLPNDFSCSFMAGVEHAEFAEERLNRHYEKLSWGREWQSQLPALVCRCWKSWLRLADGEHGSPCGSCQSCLDVVASGTLAEYVNSIKNRIEGARRYYGDVAVPRNAIEKILADVVIEIFDGRK